MSRDWLRVAAAMTAAGWGANQFAPLLQAYKEIDGLSQATVTGLFGAYVLGLIPALLVSGWWSQHRGKRPFVRAALVASVAASVVLAAGGGTPWLLLVGRLVSGVSIGLVMGPGTAWVKELSGDAAVGTGARRATVALSSGFALGPLVGGLLAQLAPWPLVLTYLVHVALSFPVLAQVWQAPELDAADHPTPRARDVVDAVTAPWFLTVLPFVAPWVFGAVATSFVMLPTSVAASLRGVAVLVIGCTAAATLGTGVLAQPHIRRLEERRPGTTLPLGLALLIAGLALGVVLVVTRQPWLLAVTAPLLGAAYGTLMVGGLRTVETHTPVHLLAPVSSVYYSLTYLGFFAPYVVALLQPWLPTPVALGVGAALGVPVLGWVLLRGRAARPTR